MKNKKQQPCFKLLTNKLTLRIANCHSIFVMVIGFIIRFSHFAPKEVAVEHTNSDGSSYVTAETINVSFPFVVTSIFVLPPLIALFILAEFRVKPEYIAKYFNFLDNPIGKGIFLMMIGLMISEV